ncbi:MAG: glycosyltransferase family 39 protein, partial [bacterium]
LTSVVHGLALALFGRTMTAIRILDLLWLAATALALFFLLRRLLQSDWPATLAALLLPVVYSVLGYWHTAQTDGWLNLPLALALLCAWAGLRSKSGAGWLGFGALVGVAALLKYTVALLAPLVFLVALVEFRREPRRLLRATLLAAAGFAGVIGACVALLAVSGALPAFIESQFGLMPSYTKLTRTAGSSGPVAMFLKTLFTNPSLVATGILLALGSVGLAVGLVADRTRRTALLLVAAWLVTAFVSTYAQGKFFAYHYLPLLPVAATAAAYALLAPVSRRRAGTGLRLGLALAAIAAVVLISRWPARAGDALSVAGSRAALEEYWRSPRHDSGRDFSLRANLALSDYLRQTTQPATTIYLWGYEPMVYFLARRPTVTRFLYNFPLIVNWQTGRFRDELIAQYTAHPADVFIVEHEDATPWVTGHDKDSFETLMEFDALRDYVAEHYLPDTRIGRFDVYRRAVD